MNHTYMHTSVRPSVCTYIYIYILISTQIWKLKYTCTYQVQCTYIWRYLRIIFLYLQENTRLIWTSATSTILIRIIILQITPHRKLLRHPDLQALFLIKPKVNTVSTLFGYQILWFSSTFGFLIIYR